MTSTGPGADLAGLSRLTQAVHEPGIHLEKVISLYDQWAQTYDKELTSEAVRYIGPRLSAGALGEIFGERKDVCLLDAGAGTGLVGEEMQKLGFTTIDALDASQQMLEMARAKNVYRHLMQATLGPTRLPIEDNTYDALVAVGVFLEGHAKSDCFPELIRIVKPGGWLLLMMKESNCALYEPEIVRLEAEAKWTCVQKKAIPEYYAGGVGLVFTLRLAL